MSDKKPPVIVMLDGPAAGAMAALSLAAASMKTTQVLVAMDSAEQTAPTPRTDEYERSIRKPHPVYGLVRPGEKNPMGRFLDLIRSVEADAKEWKEQHENLLAMFRTSEDRAAKAERELSAAKDEAERLREALKPQIMPSVGLAIGTRLRDFYRNRFALVNPVQHTDNERQVILAALKLLLAALATTRKDTA